MPQPPTPDPDWMIQIYRVRGERQQQRILSAFERIRRPGMRALGVHADGDCFIVLECGSWLGELQARRLVTVIDPGAVRTYECRAPLSAPMDHALLVRSTLDPC